LDNGSSLLVFPKFITQNLILKDEEENENIDQREDESEGEDTVICQGKTKVKVT